MNEISYYITDFFFQIHVTFFFFPFMLVTMKNQAIYTFKFMLKFLCKYMESNTSVSLKFVWVNNNHLKRNTTLIYNL